MCTSSALSFQMFAMQAGRSPIDRTVFTARNVALFVLFILLSGNVLVSADTLLQCYKGSTRSWTPSCTSVSSCATSAASAQLACTTCVPEAADSCRDPTYGGRTSVGTASTAYCGQDITNKVYRCYSYGAGALSTCAYPSASEHVHFRHVARSCHVLGQALRFDGVHAQCIACQHAPSRKRLDAC